MNLQRIFAAIVILAFLRVPMLAQSADREHVDLAMMTKIRAEGFTNSQVMETLGYLTDVIGPRLTGSPELKTANTWCRQQLEQWGLTNAHLEQWGPFGRGWGYDRVMVRLVSPVSTQFQAIPKAWTPGTNGPVRGKVVRIAKPPESEADLSDLKGKLSGAIVLWGGERRLDPLTTPLSTRYSAADLDHVEEFEIRRGGRQFDRNQIAARIKFQQALASFLVNEKVTALIEPSPWDRGVIRVMGTTAYREGEQASVPTLVMAVENYNRLCRMIDRKIDLELEVDVHARFYDDDAMCYNTIAEIPGTDKKSEVVMVGAHLDSWHGGTGATDNGVGSAVAMEAMRILQTIGVRPRRTIRIALWTGEEQGLLGSRSYVEQHFATRPEPTDPEEKALPSFLRKPTGPLALKPEHSLVSVYFNLDNGTGKIRGIYTEGNSSVAPIFASWFAPFADLGAETVTLNPTSGTDHQSFDRVGLPGFQFIQDEIEYSNQDGKGLTHHSNMDTLDHVQVEDVMQASVIMAAFLYDAAMREEMLPRKPLPK